MHTGQISRCKFQFSLPFSFLAHFGWRSLLTMLDTSIQHLMLSFSRRRHFDVWLLRLTNFVFHDAITLRHTSFQMPPPRMGKSQLRSIQLRYCARSPRPPRTPLSHAASDSPAVTLLYRLILFIMGLSHNSSTNTTAYHIIFGAEYAEPHTQLRQIIMPDYAEI